MDAVYPENKPVQSKIDEIRFKGKLFEARRLGKEIEKTYHGITVRS
jgi:hypothetical protein